MSFFSRKDKPYIVAGPCSAESEEQLNEIAEKLADINIDLFRAGIWKPRTRPGMFEGFGEEGLKWLQDIKKHYKLPVTVEVATSAHVEKALEYEIDVLWIGARSTVNPFQVQRIADALKGVNIPVMVKNPVNPDASLWLGAIERLEKSGITDIAAVHRGFSSYNAPSEYRNQPNWPIPIELKRLRPDIPLLCDPSHITGNSSKVADVAYKAMNMGFEGLMIETHTHPEEALSDSAQQITPDALNSILESVTIRKTTDNNISKDLGLEHLRQLMDGVDAEIIDLIKRRMELSLQIGHIKKECNMAAYQPKRWRDIVETRSSHAGKSGLDKGFIITLFEKIHHYSISKQLEILKDAIKEQKS